MIGICPSGCSAAADGRYCPKCGRLIIKAYSCSHQIQFDDSRFCKECGHRILAAIYAAVTRKYYSVDEDGD